MTITRRGFLTGMLALGAAPAIVRATSLMRVVTPAGLLVIEYDLSSVVGGDLSCVTTTRRLPDGTLAIIDIQYMEKQFAERMQLVREMIMYGVLTRG